MSDYIVSGCSIPGGKEADIEIRNGTIDRISPAGEGDVESFDRDQRFDADGGVVSPPLVEPHTHVFGSLTEGRPHKNQKGTLEQAWRTGAKNRADLTKEEVEEKARKVLSWFAAYGITRIRTHLSTTSEDEDPFMAAEVMVDLREEFAGDLEIQIVAIPTKGFARNETLLETFETMFEMGIDVVGGMPHREDTRERGVEHVNTALDVAESFALPVDFHVDETDDPNSRYTEVLAASSRDRGIGERVTASHTTAMHSYPDAYADKLCRLLDESGVSVVTNPLSNSVLQGRYDDYPRRRGHTRIDELSDAGVTVAIGQDDISDSANPYGDGDLLKVVYYLAHFAHMNRIDDAPILWEMMTRNNAAVFGVDSDEYGLKEGNEGSLVVYDAVSAFDAIRTVAPRTLVLKDGAPLARTERTTTVFYDGEDEVDFTHEL